MSYVFEFEDVNIVTLIGTVSKKPVSQEIPNSQKTFVKLWIYTVKNIKNKEKESTQIKTYHDVTVFDSKYHHVLLTKVNPGDQILVRGELTRRQDKEKSDLFYTSVSVNSFFHTIKLIHNVFTTQDSSSSADTSEVSETSSDLDIPF